jgi:hypothetical protein
MIKRCYRISGILIQVLMELPRRWWLGLRSTRSLKAENLFLRRQLALYVERSAKRRRIDPATRILLSILSRFFDWRDSLVAVRPETMIRWHERDGDCSGGSNPDLGGRRFPSSCKL